MKISIVTPSFNQAHFIKATLDDIFSQDYDGELEVIVMDGGSTDGTIDILASYGDRVIWESGKDKGQSDAVNKGVERATGEMIGWLFYLKMAILAFFLIWFVLAKRPFCRVACPMGAIWALFNRKSLLKSKVEKTCPDCGQCTSYCPMDLEVYKEVDSENCIKCLDCTMCKHVSMKFNLKD